MDKINYLSNSTTAQNGKFPVTIQGLEFIQKQLLQLQNCALFAGDGVYIIRNSHKDVTGICVVYGEVLPIVNIRSVKATHLQITVQKETVSTDSGVYSDIREIRVAKWTVSANDASSATLIPREQIGDFKSNSFLWSKIQEIVSTMRDSLPIEVGVKTITDLNGYKDTIRLICLKGSASILGHTSYCIDVIPEEDFEGHKVTQILTAPNMCRYGRSYNPVANTWTNFAPIDGEAKIEIKIVRGALYVRHGYLPEGTNIVVLRKRYRNTNAGAIRPRRTEKLAWFHGWKMVLSKGVPNRWYIPTVTSTDKDYIENIGKPVHTALTGLLYVWNDKTAVARWQIAGVHKKWTGARRAYARLAVAVVASNRPNTTIDSCAKFKFRVQTRINGVIDKVFSVE